MISDSINSPRQILPEVDEDDGRGECWCSSMTPVFRFGEGGLFEYNSEHRLLICRDCQYAIQKPALESHLLRHKIYRSNRQRLLSSITQLDLVEPQNVLLPPPGSPPVAALPILSGYRCTAEGCQHLTVSSKRIKRHWNETHALGGAIPFSLSFTRPVKLQTFFRGTKVRYFEVASPAPPPVDEDDDGDDGDDHESYDQEGENAVQMIQPPEPHVSAPSVAAHGPLPTHIDLETLTYFHHFIAVTSLTLPDPEHPQSTKHYWQTQFVSQALRRRWLMCGLLAISAHHLAVLTDDTISKQTHREREARFSAEFSSALEETTGYGSGFETDEPKEAKTNGQQIRGLLRCAQCAWTEAIPEDVLGYPSQLLSLISAIRDCNVHQPPLRYNGIHNDGHDGQEKFSVSEAPQTGNSLLGGDIRTSSSSDNTPPALLSSLRTLPFRIAEGVGRPENSQEVVAIFSAIDKIIECCAISFASDEVEAVWRGMATWSANVPDHFNQMLSRHHPAALIVVAHWAAILIKRAERVGCWFVKGLAKNIVLQVTRQLSANGCALLGLVEILVVIVNA